MPAFPIRSAVAALLVASAPAASFGESLVNDYPTEARAEYVFGCMAANGQSQDVLRRCACSIDQIASILPFEDYTAAETVLRMRQGGGERGALFRGAPAIRDVLADLRRAQAEAEMICF
ncbi:hypothetical protein [uncultured Paracoccus sp.]|uniref:hypothetical protein n=1 Tax=uncultured Paracoccus sp. TaxID=189685 RepID=UPI00262117AE|nr:hypothetical protein [uncultured Paracoccus sp.]